MHPSKDDGDTTSPNCSTSDPLVKASKGSFGTTGGKPQGAYEYIIFSSGKQLDEPEVTQGEDGKCVVKEKGKSLMKEEIDVVPKDKEQGSHKEVTRAWVVEPIDPRSLPRTPCKGQA